MRASMRLLAVVSCAVFVAALIAVGGASAAGPSASAARLRDCGALHNSFIAIVSRDVRCSTARTVGRRYMNGRRRPLGFRCRRFSVQAAAGWQARCTRGGQLVRIIPE